MNDDTALLVAKMKKGKKIIDWKANAKRFPF